MTLPGRGGTMMSGSGLYPGMARVLISLMMLAPAWSVFGGTDGVGYQQTPLILPECSRPASLAPVFMLEPVASGTISDHPEWGIRGLAPMGEDVQSSYFRTTEMNREFRRGFMEFAIPLLWEQPARVMLVFAEGPASTVPGAPPVRNELSWYPADLTVEVADYDQRTTFLAGFVDSLQDPNEVWSFDVTGIVREFAGSCLGFRVKLVVDPDETREGGFGTTIGRYVWIPPHLELEYGLTGFVAERHSR